MIQVLWWNIALGLFNPSQLQKNIEDYQNKYDIVILAEYPKGFKVDYDNYSYYFPYENKKYGYKVFSKRKLYFQQYHYKSSDRSLIKIKYTNLAFTHLEHNSYNDDIFDYFSMLYDNLYNKRNLVCRQIAEMNQNINEDQILVGDFNIVDKFYGLNNICYKNIKSKSQINKNTYMPLDIQLDYVFSNHKIKGQVLNTENSDHKPILFQIPELKNQQM